MLLNVKGRCPLHSVKFQKIPSGANMKSALKPKKCKRCVSVLVGDNVAT